MERKLGAAYETKGLLIGEAAGRRVTDGIRRLLLEFREVRHVNEVLTMHMGPEFILLNLSVKFADDVTALELEQTVARIEKRIRNDYPLVRRIFVEAEQRRQPA